MRSHANPSRQSGPDLGAQLGVGILPAGGGVHGQDCGSGFQPLAGKPSTGFRPLQITILSNSWPNDDARILKNP